MRYVSFLHILILIFIIAIYPNVYSDTTVISSDEIVIEKVASVKIPYTYNYYFGTTVTPYTISKGMYSINFVIYGSGNIGTKLHVGLWEFFTLGITEDVYGIIGSGSVSANIPMVSIKFSILENYNRFSLALALDDISIGTGAMSSNPDYFKNMYGLHIPFAIRYTSIFSESDLVFGIKFPFLPWADANTSNLYFYLSSNLDFSEYLKLYFGFDKISFSQEKINYSVLFTEIKFSPVRSFSVSILLLYHFIPMFERMLKIEYISSL